jgi:uncharacterized cupredoxin-like copper-binding protein
MSAETLFYIAGIVLVLAALGISAFGLRHEESFPSTLVLRLGGLVFAVIVAVTATFAVVNARDEQEHRNEELAAEKEGLAGAGAETIPFTVAPGSELAFEEKSANGMAGLIEIELANESEVGHDVTIEKGSKELGKTEIISKSTAATEIDLKPGKYTFFCSVPGHREAGMEGTLTIK